MLGKPVKIPGPDHPITISRNPDRVVVRLGDVIVADSQNALTLREASHPAVQYIPRADADMALLQRTDHAKLLPLQGRGVLFQRGCRWGRA